MGQGSILMQYILFINKTKIKMHHEDVMGHVYSTDEADRKLAKGTFQRKSLPSYTLVGQVPGDPARAHMHCFLL